MLRRLKRDGVRQCLTVARRRKGGTPRRSYGNSAQYPFVSLPFTLTDESPLLAFGATPLSTSWPYSLAHFTIFPPGVGSFGKKKWQPLVVWSPTLQPALRYKWSHSPFPGEDPAHAHLAGDVLVAEVQLAKLGKTPTAVTAKTVLVVRLMNTRRAIVGIWESLF